MGSIERLFFVSILLSCFLFSLFPQNTVSLTSEISRLETLSQNPGNTASYLNLARLYRLSGNSEAALKVLDAVLAASPGDGRTLIEQAKLLVSIGEYEKALAGLYILNQTAKDEELLKQGNYLNALIDAFRSGNTHLLVSLAQDPAYLSVRNGIYYALWKITALEEYRGRLTAEFPLSPEAKIASGGVKPVHTPLWLLFPGRGGETFVTASIGTASAASVPPEKIGLLQTGLFSSIENANAMSDRLKKAGFETRIMPREVNNGNFWAVCVPYGQDMASMILKLKNSGFESFPVR